MATTKTTEVPAEEKAKEIPAPPADAQPPTGPDPMEDAGIDVPQTDEVIA